MIDRTLKIALTVLALATASCAEAPLVASPPVDYFSGIFAAPSTVVVTPAYPAPPVAPVFIPRPGTTPNVYVPGAAPNVYRGR